MMRTTEHLLRPMQPDDVNGVVALHLRVFPGFFLSFLGPAFLRELYRGIVTDPSGIGYVCQVANHTIGFVAGTDHPAEFYKRLLRRRGWRFALASVKAVLRRPGTIPRLWRALSMPKQVASAERGVERYAELISLGVSPEAQGRGAGTTLIQAFLKETAQRNVSKTILATDRLNNDAVNAFYVNAGFVCARTIVTPEGRQMNEYEYRFCS